MTHPAPPVEAVVETAVYAADLTAAEAFYAGIFGLPVIGREAGRHVFFRVGAGSVLLVFDPAATLRGGLLPPHGTTGPGHLAVGVRAESLAAWRGHLAARRVLAVRPRPGRELGRAGHPRRVGHAGRVVMRVRTASAEDAESFRQLARVRIGNVLGPDVVRHPLAEIVQERLDRSFGAVGQELDAAVGQVPHPAADLRVAAGDPGRGRPEPDALHVPGVMHQLRHAHLAPFRARDSPQQAV